MRALLVLMSAAASAAAADIVFVAGCERVSFGGGRGVYGCAAAAAGAGLPAGPVSVALWAAAAVLAATAATAHVSYRRARASGGTDPDTDSDEEDARLAQCLAAALKHVSQLEGVSSAGWEHARSTILSFGYTTPTRGGADWLLREADYSELDPAHLSERQKRLLLRSVIEVATTDGEVTDDEQGALSQVAQRLWGCPPEQAQARLRPLLSVVRSRGDPEKLEAFSVLGISSDAGAAQIHTAYRALTRPHHPEMARTEDHDDADERPARINAAYDYLLGVTR